MTAANYPACLSAVLASEGGYSDNPNDPGGATMQGITQVVYSAYRRAHGQPTAAVRMISPAEVREIYAAQYWVPVHGDELPAGVDLAVFDYGVNSGVVRGIMALQSAVGDLDVDGQYGLLTAAAVLRANDRAGLINRICDRRLSFLESLRGWKFFAKGWRNRVAAVRARALAMNATPPAVVK